MGDLRYVQFCYCHSTQARFREWLKKKYGTVEALNKAWYRTVKTWDEVEPPRYGTILTFTDYIDWKEFISDKLAEDLALKAAAVKAVLPDTVVTSHSAGPGIFTRPDWSGTPDDRKMSDSVDFYGSSIYPKHAWTIKPWSPFYRSSGLDFVRSMGMGNDGFYIGELQAGLRRLRDEDELSGRRGRPPRLDVERDRLRRPGRQHLRLLPDEHGLRGRRLRPRRARRQGHRAGRRGREDRPGRHREQGPHPRRPAVPKAEIAILYNPLAHMVGGQQSFTGEGQTVGVNNLSESLQGIHKAFFERNIPVDFLHVNDLGTPRTAGYKLIVAPYPVQMSQPHVRKLLDYVREGGTLVTEARCGWVDEKGVSSPVIPGGGLHEALGCRELMLTPIPKTSADQDHDRPRIHPPAGRRETSSTPFSSRRASRSSARTSVVLAEFGDGRPAMVAAPFGKGRAVIVGTFPGSAYFHFKNPNNGKFFAGLADWLRIARPVEVASSEPETLVEGRALEGEGYRILFAFNRGEKRTTARVGVLMAGGKFEARELETERAVPFARENGRVVVERTLEPDEVWVVLIRKIG